MTATQTIQGRMARVDSRRAERGERRRRPRDPMRWVVLAVVAAGAVLVLAPLAIMLLNAFKTSADYSQNGPLSIPREIYLDGLVRFWNRVDFPVKFANSLFISVASATLAVVLSLLNSFALGIGRVRGRTWWVAAFMIATMLPGEGFIYPLFTMARATGLGNSQWTMVIILGVLHTAFGTYLLSSVMSTFPREMIEAAQLDGAGRWRTLRNVVLPIVRPTLSVLFIFFFIWAWNEFFFSLIFLTSSSTQTIPLAIASLQGDRLMDVPTINAGSLVSLLPAVVFFLVFQRTLTRGLTAGALK
jgi:raffinose/stachyose/melibiose transport system permease protein